MIITGGNEVPFSLVPGLLGPALLKMCVLLKSHVLTLFASDIVLISRSLSIISTFEMDII